MVQPSGQPDIRRRCESSQHHIGTVAGLRPDHERVKAFRLLVRLLGVADARRREQCRAWFGEAPCPHDWHRLGPASPGGNSLG
ncbi:DUF5958 family protein [Streptacidiphilus melanogenes]|uniref:DUF5958 family protein n=1 Tax=Streptacidiphilus melanogenes TaxID=411235 RepID=UPI000AAA693F|nr:DUF5958 family protein [Streptacidiphilus melanogenes]